MDKTPKTRLDIMLIDSIIKKDPKFRLGYQCEIDDIKAIFEHAKIFNPKMDIVILVEDWEKIMAVIQKKILGDIEN